MAAARWIRVFSNASAPLKLTPFTSSNVARQSLAPLTHSWNDTSRTPWTHLTPIALVGVGAFFTPIALCDDNDKSTPPVSEDAEKDSSGEGIDTAFSKAKPEFKSHPEFVSFMAKEMADKTPFQQAHALVFSDDYYARCKEACTGDLGTKDRLVRTMRDKQYSVPDSGPFKGRLCKQEKEGLRAVVPFSLIEYTIWFKHVGEKGHLRGRQRTFKALRENYVGIPARWIDKYKTFCEYCQQDQRRKQDSRIKPIQVNLVWERHQCDLIDLRKFQCKFQGISYKWLLHLKDHHSRYSFLVALEKKEARGVLDAVMAIYDVFGPPCIFQTDNGKEFTAEVLQSAFKERWPGIQLLNGRARHPQSQGSVERANAVVEEYIRLLLRSQPGMPWADPFVLKSIAWAMNTTFSEPLQMTPYKCLFGYAPRLEEQAAGMCLDKAQAVAAEF
ncbi:hypothetical protein CYMTET_4289 [Cymbomonas tetramitiformis]|uniref:Integrase catalytic domain-containing protein n=1 Tax=Cymbomonas tetramitiformis TaxID=36881 RepID=A0AAE0H1N0_9CHLO|nr:hypothetical protein CYMTET_4289 [Cymbomonas tetramitiformis]